MQNRHIQKNKSLDAVGTLNHHDWYEAEATDFNAYYLAAVTGDETMLKALIKEHACIDERNGKWLSAAHKLHTEGKKSAVALLEKYGANLQLFTTDLINTGKTIEERIDNAFTKGTIEEAKNLCKEDSNCIDYLAHVAAAHGYMNYVQALHSDHQADNTLIVMGAALGGYERFAYIYRLSITNIEPQNLKDIAFLTARGGHAEHAEKWLARSHSIKPEDLLRGALAGGHLNYADHLQSKYKLESHIAADQLLTTNLFKNASNALYHFSRINNETYREQLAKALSQAAQTIFAEAAISPPIDHYDIIQTAKNAAKVRHLMVAYQLNYSQATALVAKPEWHNFILAGGRSLFKDQGCNINNDVFFDLLRNELQLSLSDTQSLHEKLVLHAQQRLLSFHLEKYFKTNGHFPFGLFIQKGRKLHEKTQQAKNLQDFYAAIEAEHTQLGDSSQLKKITTSQLSRKHRM